MEPRRSSWKRQLLETMGQRVICFCLYRYTKIKLYYHVVLCHFAELQLEMVKSLKMVTINSTKRSLLQEAKATYGDKLLHSFLPLLLEDASVRVSLSIHWHRVHSQPHGPVCVYGHTGKASTPTARLTQTHTFTAKNKYSHSHTHKHCHIVYLDTIDTEGYNQ